MLPGDLVPRLRRARALGPICWQRVTSGPARVPQHRADGRPGRAGRAARASHGIAGARLCQQFISAMCA